MKLTFLQKQLILYTRGHYGEVDYDSHLKYFAGFYFQIQPDHITKHHVFKFVSETYHDLQKQELVTFRFDNFMDEILKSARFEGKDTVQLNDIMIRMLIEISECELEDYELREKVNSLEKIMQKMLESALNTIK